MLARSLTIGAGSAVAVCMPLAAQAEEAVKFASDVFVEKFVTAPGGARSRVLARADRLNPGDQVIFVVNWTALRGTEFTVTNPLPRTVVFQRSVDGAEEVSVDGGRSWGQLDALRLRSRDGTVRSATPEDVTHLRWRVPSLVAVRRTGQLMYRGTVR